jgi:alcohol dehydrogenase
LSGKAINISKTTAPHAFSYGITNRYGVPHGAAVALTLGAFLIYNYQVDDSDCVDPRGVSSVKKRIEYILKLLGDGSMDKSQKKLKSIIENIGCPLRLREVGIKKDDLSGLVSMVNVERLSNNPRKIDAPELSSLLELILSSWTSKAMRQKS